MARLVRATYHGTSRHGPDEPGHDGRLEEGHQTTTVSAADHAISAISPTARRRTPAPEGSFSTISEPSGAASKYRRRSPANIASVTVVRSRLQSAEASPSAN